MSSPKKKSTSSPEKKPSDPPEKSAEELEAEAALEAACEDAKKAAAKLDQSATSLRRTISDPRMKAVRLPTPSQIEIDEVDLPPVKR